MVGSLAPEKPLPFPKVYNDVEEYVDALLDFVCDSEMLRTLCGGVHILDFLIREPDHFSTILPHEWRSWLVQVSIPDLLDLTLRENITPLLSAPEQVNGHSQWRGFPVPPRSLLDYIMTVRNLCLDRTFVPSTEVTPGSLSRTLAVGMKPKKAHEVEYFAAFVNSLMSDIANTSEHHVTHVLDFGSGQNYLGRVLASPLYQRHIIAVESRQTNVDGARKMDISAKLAKKIVVWRNKKEFRATGYDSSEAIRSQRDLAANGHSADLEQDPQDSTPVNDDDVGQDSGRIQYIEHRITDGDLSDVLRRIQHREDTVNSQATQRVSPEVMVISLHSCGNLLHHGLRSLVLNPKVKAVAMVGCCYNLTTERLGSSTVKIPNLRTFNKRVEDSASACDPHGFPMSEKLVSYQHRDQKGIRMNITARMMAVQAPQNWTESNSDSFFTRHFYRALLQRVFVDRGLLKRHRTSVQTDPSPDKNQDEAGEPLTLGSLRKACYQSFVTYVRGAVAKLKEDPLRAEDVERCMGTLTDDDIMAYWEHYKHKKHELSIVWSLMAFSAGVVESLIVTDRWLFLNEQESVKTCWAQTVFDYKLSPRNFVVVGIKK